MSSIPIEVDSFAFQARAFLEWCESSHDGKAPALFQYEATQQLVKAYAAALELPGVDARDTPEPPLMSEEQRRVLAHNLRALPFQCYWEVFTPTDLDGDKEPVCGDLFDDFSISTATSAPVSGFSIGDTSKLPCSPGARCSGHIGVGTRSARCTHFTRLIQMQHNCALTPRSSARVRDSVPSHECRNRGAAPSC